MAGHHGSSLGLTPGAALDQGSSLSLACDQGWPAAKGRTLSGVEGVPRSRLEPKPKAASRDGLRPRTRSTTARIASPRSEDASADPRPCSQSKPESFDPPSLVQDLTPQYHSHRAGGSGTSPSCTTATPVPPGVPMVFVKDVLTTASAPSLRASFASPSFALRSPAGQQISLIVGLLVARAPMRAGSNRRVSARSV